MYHFYALNGIMEQHGWPKGGGSYLIDGQSLDYNPVTFAKQELLFNTVRDLPYPSLVLEIGVYSGHSALIMLIANPHVHILGVDPCYPFTQPCIDYLNSVFKNLSNENRYVLTKGDSTKVLPDFRICDYAFISIDGNHGMDAVLSDFDQSKRLLVKEGLIICDDWDGVGPQLPQDLLDQIEIIEVADCPNPNALIRFK